MKKRIVDLCTSLLLILILVSAVSVARADSDDGIVRVKSAVPMGEAIARIKTDIAGKGIKFFMEIDQSKLAAGPLAADAG
jgi:imidazoleglycerol phosphate dehydratase HisB